MTPFLLLWLWLLLPSSADAGAPPVEIIPWDSVVVTDTLYAGDHMIVDTHVVKFITESKYMRDVLGMDAAVSLEETRHDIEVIKQALMAKKAKGK